MLPDAVPLSQLIHVLPLPSGVRLLRALRQQVDVACLRVPGTGGPRYALSARVGTHRVQTGGYPAITPALVDELMSLLAPLLRPPEPSRWVSDVQH